MKSVANVLALGVLIGLGLGIPLAIYLALDAVLYGLKIILLVLGGTGLAVLGYIGILKWRQQDERRRRLVDGSYPLQQHKVKGLGTLVVDANKSVSGVYLIHKHLGYMEICANNMDLQAIYAGQVQTTRHLEALTTGDDAQIRTGMINGARSGIANSATAKWLDGAFRPQPKPLPALPAPVDKIITPPAPRLTLTDALNQSTGHRWIVGQSDDGQIAAFEPAVHFSAGILGSSGTAKTSSAGFTVALAALRAGWHVAVINPNGNRRPPDGGPDWYLLENHIELHETDAIVFPGQVESLYNFYTRRAAVSNPQPVMIIFEEYGNLNSHLRVRSKSDADSVDLWLDTLLTQGRKSRVHATFIDQDAEGWTNRVLGGTKFKMVFQMGPYRGDKVKEYKADQLPPVGRFLVRGVEYASFNATAELPAILRQLPAPNSARRVINGTATHVVSTNSTQAASSPTSSPARSFAGSPSSPQVVDPPIPPASEPTEPPGPTDIQAQAIAYIAANPAAKQSKLMHDLGIAKSYAHELWHTHNPKGTNYKLPTDSMDLTNDTDREQFRQMLAAGTVTFPEAKEK